MTRRILPFPTRALPIAKVWNDDEVKPAYRPPAKAAADFKRVCEQTSLAGQLRED